MTKPIRQIRVEGNIAFVPLTQGQEAIIDAADVHLVDGWNWRAMVQEHAIYAVRGDYSGEKLKTALMHRLIMDAPDFMHVDHIDSNGIDNRRANMRLATRSQNMRNRGAARHNKAGFKGVFWNNRCLKWHAQIGVNGKVIYLGLHETPEAAHAAYCEASARLHGAFGRTE